MSKYGGGAALPEPARDAMKGFILKLPKQVGEAMRIGHAPASNTNVGMGSTSVTGSGSTVERDSVAAAASGRAGSDRRAAGTRRRDRGVGGSAAVSPVPSRTTSPAASPRIHPRGLHSAGLSSSSGMHEDQGPRHAPLHTMSAGTAVLAAQRILTLATESLDMMRGVTGVVKDSLDRADAWVERLKVVGVQRGDGSSDTHAVPTQSGALMSGYPQPPSQSSVSVMDRGRINLNISPNMMQYRDHDLESDPTLLSPLSMNLNLGRSRRGSVGSSSGLSGPSYSRSGSLPSTPSLSGYPPNYSPQAVYSTPYGSLNLPSYPPMDAPSPEAGLGLRRMSIRGDEEATDIKREEQEEMKMEVDG